MKKTILALCIGMMIGLLAGSVTGAFAAVGDRVEAIVAEYIIIVDGKEQVLETSPVAINDSAYVPLRAMANMLGKDVTYKADSRTIELNTPSTTTLEGGGSIVDISVITNQIADQLKNKKKYQEKIDQIIAELKGYGESDEEINKNPLLMQYRGMIEYVDTNLIELEAQKAALEAQQ